MATLLLLLLFFRLFRRRTASSSSGPAQLFLVGPNGSHKTRLFYWLSQKRLLEAVSSSRPNRAELSLSSGPLVLLDVPGYATFRPLLFSSLAHSTVLLLCVNTANKTWLEDSAEFLYSLLTNKRVQSTQSRIVVAVTQSQEGESEEKVQQELEKQLQRMVFSKKGKEYQQN